MTEFATISPVAAGDISVRDKINALIANQLWLKGRCDALALAQTAETQARASALSAESQARAAGDALALPLAAIARLWLPASRLAHEVAQHADAAFAPPPASAVVATDRGAALRVAGALRIGPALPLDPARETTMRAVLRAAPASLYTPQARVLIYVEWTSASGTVRVALGEQAVGADWTEIALALEPPADAISGRPMLASESRIDVAVLDGWISGPQFGPTASGLRLAATMLSALPAPTTPGLVRLVPDAPGGAALAVSDGAAWRRLALADILI